MLASFGVQLIFLITKISKNMIRSSSAYRICSHRPKFDENAHNALIHELKGKVGAKLGKHDNLPLDHKFGREHLDMYCETAGLITIAKKVRTSMENKIKAEQDPLPDGAKTYLQERWLELNCNLHDFSTTEGTSQILKGNVCEEDAIKVISQQYGIPMKKNEDRKVFNFLTGECDVQYENVIRDVKVPETWKTFRSKDGITLTYYWQLVSYCYLYDKTKAYLDYVLMPTPEEMIPMLTKGLSERELENFWATEETIINLPLHQRVKTYKYEGNLVDDIAFLESRLIKAEEYYETLTYEICMKMPGR